MTLSDLGGLVLYRNHLVAYLATEKGTKMLPNDSEEIQRTINYIDGVLRDLSLNSPVFGESKIDKMIRCALVER